METAQIIDELLNAFLVVRQSLEQQIQAIDGHIVQMDREQGLGQLLDTFLPIKQTLEQQVRAIDGQIAQARLEYLKDSFDRQQKELADWLGEIDQSLIDCCAYVQEYRRLHADVSALREKISELGESPPPMADPLPAGSIDSAIINRIQSLRRERKI